MFWVVCRSACKVDSTGIDQRLQQRVGRHAGGQHREGDLMVGTLIFGRHDVVSFAANWGRVAAESIREVMMPKGYAITGI